MCDFVTYIHFIRKYRRQVGGACLRSYLPIFSLEKWKKMMKLCRNYNTEVYYPEG